MVLPRGNSPRHLWFLAEAAWSAGAGGGVGKTLGGALIATEIPIDKIKGLHPATKGSRPIRRSSR